MITVNTVRFTAFQDQILKYKSRVSERSRKWSRGSIGGCTERTMNTSKSSNVRSDLCFSNLLRKIIKTWNDCVHLPLVRTQV